jgi:hypothetical protein
MAMDVFPTDTALPTLGHRTAIGPPVRPATTTAESLGRDGSTIR